MQLIRLKIWTALLFLLMSACCVWSQPDEDNPFEREGASNIDFNLMEKIETDYDFTDEYLFSINEQIFRDGNKSSGYYYYYPTEYSLNWIPGRGADKYDLNFNYGLDGQVTVTAVLKPKVGSKDIKLMKELLKENIQGKPDANQSIKGFLPVPLSTRPEIEFNNLSQFGIAEDQVDIRPPATLKNEIVMSFTTTRIDDLINMLFNDVGLYGNVLVTPDGDGVQESIAIPFNLKIDDNATYGFMELTKSFWRKGWTNPTDYPVKLNYLHILKDIGSRHQVYSWELGKIEIPEGAKADFSNANILPDSWDRDPKVKRIWLDYTIQPCRSCNERLKESFRKGGDGTTSTIKIDIANLLEFTEADKAYINLRSFQADPNQSRRKIELEPIEVLSDGGSFKRGPLYKKPDQPIDFEYQIQLAMPDGKVHTSRTWTRCTETLLVIGAEQVKKQIPVFVGKEEKEGSSSRRRPTRRGNN